MSLRLTFHRAASTEFVDASAWYESKRLGLAMEFIADIDRCLAIISHNPYQFALVHENVRRAVVSNFPYSIYYRVEESRIVVLAVFHSNRDPAIWLARI